MSISIVRPSQSPPLPTSDIVRAKSLLKDLRFYINQEVNSFSEAAGNWSKNTCLEFYKLYERLYDCSEIDLRYFRFLCGCYSGYSLYHCSNSSGTEFSKVTVANDSIADYYWNNPEFPRDCFRNFSNQINGMPYSLIFEPPLFLGEAGWIKNDRFFSVDQCFYQERVHLLYFGGLIGYLDRLCKEKGEAKVLEIGGGYGALAYALKNFLPKVSYTIIDIPESLSFSGTYLTLSRPDISIGIGLAPVKYGYKLVPTVLSQNLYEKFDLVINTLSMAEMTEYQVSEYCRLMKERWIKNGGFFFEQNFDNSPVGMTDIRPIVEQYLKQQTLIRTNSDLFCGIPSLWKV